MDNHTREDLIRHYVETIEARDGRDIALRDRKYLLDLLTDVAQAVDGTRRAKSDDAAEQMAQTRAMLGLPRG
jgi:hypothetical protein